jgi:16S rRNA (cytosine1402-N4)-methyltransferase
MTTPSHVPVLLDRVVALLRPALEREDGAPTVLVDCTLGLGGHTEAVLSAIPTARVVGVDRDPAALELAGERLAPFGDRFTGVHAVYDELPDVLEDLGLAQVDAVLFDLGVSSMQLDRRERGFAYAEDAPLDMRMDGSAGRTAADVLNSYSAAELTRVLRDFGEEKFARKIAAAIVREREREPFTRSARLVELLYAEIPAPARRTGGHPAKRTFQALRMEVNDELAVLRRALPAAIDAIGVGGRVVVESYHSLEDRMVKRAFTEVTRLDVPPDLPFVPEGSEPALRAVTRGAEQADQTEIEHNPRAASVRLRAVERVRPTPSTRTSGAPR